MFVKVCDEADIQEDGVLYRYEVRDRPIMVTRIDDNGKKDYFAADSICTHQEADVSLGIFFHFGVTCPLHQAKFDIRSGEVLEGPNGDPASSIRRLGTYRTKIENGSVLIDMQ